MYNNILYIYEHNILGRLMAPLYYIEFATIFLYQLKNREYQAVRNTLRLPRILNCDEPFDCCSSLCPYHSIK